MAIFSFNPGLESYLVAFVLPLAIAALFAYLIYYIESVIQLAVTNCALIGARGVLYALIGTELYIIPREKVIDVNRHPGCGYRATTYDGEQNVRYYVMPTEIDDSDDFKEAVTLGGRDRELFEALKPESRVRKYFELENSETGEVMRFFIVYTRDNNPREVEEALNRYFNDKYFEILKSVRHMRVATA